jgi:hypothetical protein
LCARVCFGFLLFAAGDTVGVAFDQSDAKVLRIYHNGQYLSGQDVRGMKGETWPLIIVAGGASLEVTTSANGVDDRSGRGHAALRKSLAPCLPALAASPPRRFRARQFSFRLTL